MDAPITVTGIRDLTLEGEIVAASFLGEMLVLASAEGMLLLVSNGSERRVTVHDGGLQCAAADGSRIVTGGDDGSVVAITPWGDTQRLGQDPRHRWIERIALAPDGRVAWSAGKDVTIRAPDGALAVLTVSSSGGALAFLPDSRLAVAHSGGVTLWSGEGEPALLVQPGVHAELTVSPGGDYLVSALQEPMLCGWHLAERRTIRLAGYPERVRSMDWSADGRWLATSGSNRLTLWPLQARQGPTMPLHLAPYEARLKLVACHPHRDVVAAAYADGLVLLVRIPDGAEIVLAEPAGVPVTALVWDDPGDRIAIGAESGTARIIMFDFCL